MTVTISPELSLALGLIALIAAVLYAVILRETWGAYRHEVRHRTSDRAYNNAEHAIVVATALMLVATANVLTGVGLAEHGSQPVTLVLGAVMARGFLLVTALYLLIRPPR